MAVGCVLSKETKESIRKVAMEHCKYDSIQIETDSGLITFRQGHKPVATLKLEGVHPGCVIVLNHLVGTFEPEIT